MTMIFAKTLAAIAIMLTLVGCGLDAGGHLGPYGTRASLSAGAQPGQPAGGPTALPPPLPPE